MTVLAQFGAGRIGAIHAANIAASSRGKLKYIVDVNEAAAADLAAAYGASVSDVNTVCADPEVDAVVIASSTDTHADLIEAAAGAGKAVFCEKPVDLNLERVDAAIAAVDKAGVIAMVGFNRRFDPNLGGLGEAVLSGRIGDLETLIITSRDPSPPPISYINVSGGLFRDMMIHDFDLAHWILGEAPVEVFARGANLVDPAIGEAGDVDTAAVTLTTKSGTLVHITNSRRATYGYDQRLEAFGSKGMLLAENLRESTLTSWTADGVVAAKPLHFFLERYQEAYAAEMEHFIGCVEGGTTPKAGMLDGRVALMLADAAQESMTTGQPVSLAGGL